jgi:hypothetical protein
MEPQSLIIFLAKAQNSLYLIQGIARLMLYFCGMLLIFLLMLILANLVWESLFVTRLEIIREKMLIYLENFKIRFNKILTQSK